MDSPESNDYSPACLSLATSPSLIGVLNIKLRFKQVEHIFNFSIFPFTHKFLTITFVLDLNKV